MIQERIPDIIVGRLPRYLQALTRMMEAGISNTSSQDLGKRIGISAAQIRKDLSQFGEFGKQGTGYSVPYLVDQLQTILKVKEVWDVILVGVGDLGHAIARYQGFTNRGFRIVAVFDNDHRKIGTLVGAFTVMDFSEAANFIKNSDIKIAMLTVPASSAQKVAQKLVADGIKAILSYAPIPLNLPPEVRVEYIDPIIQLQHISYYLD
jgi:redox-sensing transcriptional repressor